MTRFAILHPERVEAIVYLDALDVVAEAPPEGNPALEALELTPSEDDLASPDAYLAFQRRLPMLAIVPAGRTNPFLTHDAPEEVRRAANRYWVDRYLPWAEARVERFRDAVPSARVVGLDTSNHGVFLAREDETVRAILDFLGPSG